MTDAATNPPSPQGNPQRRKAEPTGGDAANSAGGSASGGGGSGSGGGGTSGGGKPRTFQAPKGTRDFYPHDLLRRRYIIDTWRRVSLRHGFEEIDGPTFEDSALYTVKSGEGILSELFGAYSGKDPNDTKQVQAGGPPPFALRPEFTPTLARMYAARAKQLPQPTKWFCVSNFFRAERPQRGRLREFWQWNADVIGDPSPAADAECVDPCICVLADLGLPEHLTSVQYFHRRVLIYVLTSVGVSEAKAPDWLVLYDRRSKMSSQSFMVSAYLLADSAQQAHDVLQVVGGFDPAVKAAAEAELIAKGRSDLVVEMKAFTKRAIASDLAAESEETKQFQRELNARGLVRYCKMDETIVRGLAYYTGLVFELIAEGERAVAGGGRYDKLIELFGGPPTPAVGFGMGDVVLTNLLDDRKLMPEGKDLLEATSRPLPTRPDVFVIANEAEDSQAKLVPLVASLRRGVETDKYKQADCKPWSTDRYAQSLGGTPPLHARRSYKATKNIGKLLSEATACHARYALIIENANTGTLKNMDTGEQTKDVPLDKVGGLVAQG